MSPVSIFSLSQLLLILVFTSSSLAFITSYSMQPSSLNVGLLAPYASSIQPSVQMAQQPVSIQAIWRPAVNPSQLILGTNSMQSSGYSTSGMGNSFIGNSQQGYGRGKQAVANSYVNSQYVPNIGYKYSYDAQLDEQMRKIIQSSQNNVIGRLNRVKAEVYGTIGKKIQSLANQTIANQQNYNIVNSQNISPNSITSITHTSLSSPGQSYYSSTNYGNSIKKNNNIQFVNQKNNQYALGVMTSGGNNPISQPGVISNSNMVYNNYNTGGKKSSTNEDSSLQINDMSQWIKNFETQMIAQQRITLMNRLNSDCQTIPQNVNNNLNANIQSTPQSIQQSGISSNLKSNYNSLTLNGNGYYD